MTHSFLKKIINSLLVFKYYPFLVLPYLLSKYISNDIPIKWPNIIAVIAISILYLRLNSYRFYISNKNTIKYRKFENIFLNSFLLNSIIIQSGTVYRAKYLKQFSNVTYIDFIKSYLIIFLKNSLTFFISILLLYDYFYMTVFLIIIFFYMKILDIFSILSFVLLVTFYYTILSSIGFYLDSLYFSSVILSFYQSTPILSNFLGFPEFLAKITFENLTNQKIDIIRILFISRFSLIISALILILYNFLIQKIQLHTSK